MYIKFVVTHPQFTTSHSKTNQPTQSKVCKTLFSLVIFLSHILTTLNQSEMNNSAGKGGKGQADMFIVSSVWVK